MPRTGIFELTIRIPGEKRAKRKTLNSTSAISKEMQKYPPGTEFWVMIPNLNIGYGMKMRENGLAY